MVAVTQRPVFPVPHNSWCAEIADPSEALAQVRDAIASGMGLHSSNQVSLTLSS